MSCFPTTNNGFITAVNDVDCYVLELPVGHWESQAELLDACDDFEQADRIFLCLPATGRLVNITEELAEAWLAAHSDWSVEDLELVDAINGVHGKIMRWLANSNAFQRALEDARLIEMEEG